MRLIRRGHNSLLLRGGDIYSIGRAKGLFSLRNGVRHRGHSGLANRAIRTGKGGAAWDGESLPTVLSATALFFALAGVGFAAGHYVITSTTRIQAKRSRATARTHQGERPKGPKQVAGEPRARRERPVIRAPLVARAPRGVTGAELGNSYFTPFRYPNTLPGDGTPQVVEQLSGLRAGDSCH